MRYLKSFNLPTSASSVFIFSTTSVRIARHDNRAFALENASLVNVAQSPVAIAKCLQFGQLARGINVMPVASSQARVHNPDVDRPGDRRLEFRQQAFWRVRLRETYAVDRHIRSATNARQFDIVRPAPEKLGAGGIDQLRRDFRFRVVIGLLRLPASAI